MTQFFLGCMVRSGDPQQSGVPYLSLIQTIMESSPRTNWVTIGDVANSKRPLLIIPKVQLRLRVTRRSATALARYLQKCNCACALPTEVGKNCLRVKIL